MNWFVSKHFFRDICDNPNSIKEDQKVILSSPLRVLFCTGAREILTSVVTGLRNIEKPTSAVMGIIDKENLILVVIQLINKENPLLWSWEAATKRL